MIVFDNVNSKWVTLASLDLGVKTYMPKRLNE